ncbi:MULTISPECIES: MFS transporter [unclassified Synechococcus]|uniref:MFS transporter n=1 Tax=unclassified Synechococcus TaxID=2626047 RepID=UPI0039AF4859
MQIPFYPSGIRLNLAYALLGISATESILVFALCLPLIRNEIPMGTGFLSFTVASSSLAHCSTVVPFGNLADKVGRRKIFIVGLIFGILGGLIGVFASDPLQLLASRLIVGVGEGMLMGVGLAILTTLQHPSKLPIAVSRWTVFITLSNIFALYVTSSLLSISWRISMLYTPVLWALILAVSPILLRESKVKSKEDNLLANLLLGGSFISTLYSLTRLEADGFNFAFLSFLLIGLFLLLAWHRLQKSSKNPNFPVEILTNKTYLGGVIASFSFSFMYKSMNVQLPSFLEAQEHLKGAIVGIIQMPSYIAGMISCIVIGYLISRKYLTRRMTVTIGFIVMSLGFLLLGQLAKTFNPVAVVVSTVVLTIGVYFTALPSFDIIAETAPKSFLGSVTGSHAVFAQLGGSLGLIISSSSIVLANSQNPEGRWLMNAPNYMNIAVNHLIIAVRQFAGQKHIPNKNIYYFTAEAFHSYSILFATISLFFMITFLFIYKPLLKE